MIKFTILFYNSIHPSAIIHSFYIIPLTILNHYCRLLIERIKWKLNKKSQIVYIPIEADNNFPKSNSLVVTNLTFPESIINLIKTDSFEPNKNCLRIIKHLLLYDEFKSNVILSGPSDDESHWSERTINYVKEMWGDVLKYEAKHNSKSYYSYIITKGINECHLTADPITMSYQYNYELDISTNLRSFSSVTQEEYDNIKMLKRIGFIRDGNYFIWHDRVILFEPQGNAYGDYIRNREEYFWLNGEKFSKTERIGRNELFSEIKNKMCK